MAARMTERSNDAVQGHVAVGAGRRLYRHGDFLCRAAGDHLPGGAHGGFAGRGSVVVDLGDQHRQWRAGHRAQPALPGAGGDRLVGAGLGAAGQPVAAGEPRRGGGRLPGRQPDRAGGGPQWCLRQTGRPAAAVGVRGDAGGHSVQLRQCAVHLAAGAAAAGAGDVRDLSAVQACVAALCGAGGVAGRRRSGDRPWRAQRRCLGDRPGHAGVDHPGVFAHGDTQYRRTAGRGGADRAIHTRHGRAAQQRLRPGGGTAVVGGLRPGQLAAGALCLPWPGAGGDYRGDLCRP
ncbi:hypothetical protein SRABI70_00312 [Pseudomonas sp. Bi70]|nr:hypothetical protein SRABI70_00312 [Pseudomonas sp. Bi70]